MANKPTWGPVKKGIPLPPPKRGEARRALEEMEVGDCRDLTHYNIESAHSVVHKWATRLKMKIAIRKLEGGVLRIWRIK